MRIVHVVPRGDRPWSGTLTVVVHLAQALARHGHDVEVWHLGEWSHSDFNPHIALLADAGVTRRNFEPEKGLWRSSRTIARKAFSRQTQIVHLHGAFNSTNAWLAPALNTPFVFSPHSGYDPISLRRSKTKKQVYKWLFESTMLRRAALVIALTDQEHEHVLAFASDTRCIVIPNGVARPPQVDGEGFRRSIGLRKGDRLALFVGRLDVERKGLDVLLNGIRSAPSWHLALVGPDERDGVRRIRAKIASHRLGQRVHLCGPRFGLQLHEALVSSDIFVLLSRWEGMPMALLEALAHGRPAVVSPAVERCVPVAASGAGRVAESTELGRMMEELALLDDRSKAALSAAARSLATRYEWPVVARMYEEAYKSVVAN